MKILSSHLLDNLSNCLMNLKNSGDSTGFEPMTSALPVQCSNPVESPEFFGSKDPNTVKGTEFWLSVWKKWCLEKGVADEIEAILCRS